MKENTKRYVKLSIILYIVILSVALVGTLAWFVFKQSATISTEENSKIVAGEYLEICFDDGNDNWVTDIKFANVSQQPDVSVTPDGTVWYPVSLDEGDELFVGAKGEGVYRDVTNEEGYFIKLNLKVRASKGLDLYLHSDSRIEGVNMDKTDALKSFSKDAIAGAARVGFFDENGLKTVWIPNEKIELVSDENGVTGFKHDGDAKSEYKYLQVTDGTVKEGAEYGLWTAEQLMVGSNVLATNESVNESKPILSFTEAGEKKLTIYIWVEGSDREANTVLSGGSLKYNLKFVGIEQKDPSVVNIADVEYQKGALVYASSGAEVGSEILYSRDAETWTPYSTGAPLVNGNETLYVRARETANEKAGSVKEISVK